MAIHPAIYDLPVEKHHVITEQNPLSQKNQCRVCGRRETIPYEVIVDVIINFQVASF